MSTTQAQPNKKNTAKKGVVADKAAKAAKNPGEGPDTQVAVAQTKAVAAAGKYGAFEKPKLTAKDIIIPKILAMQAMTKKVIEGTAKFGEFRDSVNYTVMGSEGKPIEFIPFHRTMEFVVMREEKGKFKFHRTEVINAENENNAYELEDAEGNNERWYRCANFFVLLPDEIKKGGALPYIMSFKSTAARAGSKIATTMFAKNIARVGVPEYQSTPASTVMELSGTKRTNDAGTFVQLDAVEKRLCTEAEVDACYEWVKTIQGGGVKIDNSDIVDEVNASGGAAPVAESDEY